MDARGNWAIVVAAGRGERLGLPYNKVFYELAGRSVLFRCIDALADSGCFEGVILVLSETDAERYKDLLKREGPHTIVRGVARGGATRQQSVANGLRLIPEDAGLIAVHDAARAFVPAEVVRQCVVSALRFGSGVAATECTDTIKRVNADGRSVETPERARLRAVQTPQVFKASLLREAHTRAAMDGFEATDEAALIEKYIGPVNLCCATVGRRNIKLTDMEDLRMMEALLSNRGVRVGHGFDVHRLVEGRRLVLCGVEVPYERGLLGHSDADVATHALMDALFGACAMGDIGRHFPDSEPAYEGVSSIELLRRVMKKMGESGFFPLNADLTIACERPRLAKFIPEMRERLASVMALPSDRVNVKATTTEGLGFVGRGEGIEAHALVSVGERA